MAEYIKRDAAIAAIKGNCWDAHTPVEAVKSVPTVDAVPVVRCKDCLYWESAIGFCHQNSQYYNDGESWDIYQPDDFCSRGERRNT